MNDYEPKITEGTLTPAYGRDYSSLAKLDQDFRAGKDFKFVHPWRSTYCSIRDCKPGDKIKVRYNKYRSVGFIIV